MIKEVSRSFVMNGFGIRFSDAIVKLSIREEFKIANKIGFKSVIVELEDRSLDNISGIVVYPKEFFE